MIANRPIVEDDRPRDAADFMDRVVVAVAVFGLLAIAAWGLW